MKKYGKTESDVIAEQKIQCRDIVSEILDFGVSDIQKQQIIKLLSLELEDTELMRKISHLMSESEEDHSDKKILTLE